MNINFQNCQTVFDFNILELKDKFLLIHKDLPKFFFTNSTGIHVLKSFEKNPDPEAISKSLHDKYNISMDVARQDTKQYIEQFHRFDLFLDEARSYSKLEDIKPEIKRLNINLTSGCNLSCIHCGAQNTTNRINFLDKKIVNKIIVGFLYSENKSIVFTGGEPMLHPDWLDIIELSQSYGRTILASNCTLLKKEEIKRLADMNVIMQVSLESPRAEMNDKIRGKGNFNKVLENLKLLVDHDMGDRIAICMTLTKFNAHEVKEMVDFTKSLGISSFRLLPLQKINRAVKNWGIINPSQKDLENAYRTFYRILTGSSDNMNVQGGIPGLYLNFWKKSMWCQIGTSINIDDQQNVYPCSLLMNKNFYLGNLEMDSLEKIENSVTLKKLIQQFYNRKKLITKCSKCAMRSICQGGCPGTVWNDYGDIYNPDDLCALRVKQFVNLLTNFDSS